ncbi:putative MltA-interacting protein precursor [Desulfosarcina variabilis str. Montpellier]|uniref:MipA/OmpV family protein n=1 Tax=Desulfosarcina variabilis TaxID=2300 RepID=UPI003AFB1DEB
MKVKTILLGLSIALLILIGHNAFCEEQPPENHQTRAPDKWGIAMGLRSATIVFDAEKGVVNDVVPLIFYENGPLFIDGLEFGYRLFQKEKWQLSPFARYRFFDIPERYQNEIRESGLDMGGQFTYHFTDWLHTNVEVLSDQSGRFHANLAPGINFERGIWELRSYARFRWKSAAFNDRYYGLGREDPGMAMDAQLAADIRLHVWRNLYLLARGSILFLDSDTRDVSFIDESYQSEAFLGIGFFNDKKDPVNTLASKPYVRLAHGWGTESNLGEIMTGNTESDPYNNQLSSVFLGVPLADRLFTLPIATYLTPGIVHHHSSDVQDRSTEYVLAVKFYYTIKWPIPWRLGFAEGLSYLDRIPYLEEKDMQEKDYRPSQLLNFLDFSLDLSLGHLLRVEWMEDLWLGYSIHHRSGIYSKSSAFGRISGGSNYNTVYLQYHW